MGINSYMCAHCNRNIRNSEGAILFHVRHGKILGKSIGWNDEYGRVSDTDDFFSNDDSINSLNELNKSRFMLEDSGLKSGISAMHIPCFKKALKKNRNLLSQLPISEADDNQGLGKPREWYTGLMDVVKFRDEEIEEILSTHL